MKVYISENFRERLLVLRALYYPSGNNGEARPRGPREEIPRVIFRQRTWPYMRILFSPRICMKFEKFSNKHGGNTAARKRVAVNGTFPFPLLTVRLRKSSSTSSSSSSSSRRSCKNLKPRAISREREKERKKRYSPLGEIP